MDHSGQSPAPSPGGPRAARELTGRHVLAMVVGFFAVITVVNIYMASQAIGTFPGVEAKNTYYASQNFDAARKKQEALGWTVTDRLEGGELRLSVTDRSGAPAKVADFQVLIGRATERNEDLSPVFARDGADFVTPLALAPGKWLLRLEVVAEDGTVFRQSRSLFVKG